MTTMVIPAETPAKSTSNRGVNALPPLKVTVHIDAEVLNPETARRKADVWLLLYVGHLLRADNPELLWEDNELLWRYDVVLTQLNYGVVGKIGCVRVHATTGQVMADANVRGEWNRVARKLLQEKGLPMLDADEASYAEDEDTVTYALEITHS